MNDRGTQAQEAQLDWALGEATDGDTPPDVLTEVRARIAAPAATATAPVSRRWLAAACVLLGIGAIVAAFCERARRPPAALQQPEPRQPQTPLPEPSWLTAASAEELAKVPDDCQALRLFPEDAQMIAGLARLKQLAHLDLGLTAATAAPPPLDAAMLIQVGKLTSLRELRLEYRGEIEPAWLQPLEGLPLLESLSAKYVPIDDATAAKLAALPALRKLDLAFDNALGDEGLAALAAMPGLRELSLRGCGKLTPKGLVALGKAVRLEVLDLSCVVGMVTGGLPRGPDGKPTPPAVMKRGEWMMLTEMMVAAKPGGGVTDEVLQALRPLDKLRELHLQACSISADGLKALTGRQLRALDLSVRGDFAPFVEQLPPALETLGLPWCRSLTDADLEAIAKRLPVLQRLDLTACAQVTDAGLEALLGSCPIRELKLESCGGLTVASLPVLLETKSLRKLDVTGLRWVDEAARTQLRARPELEVESRALPNVMRAAPTGPKPTGRPK